MEITTPIIVAEGWDVELYVKVSDAELSLEPIDVKDAIYTVYDAQGRLLIVSTDGERVFITLDENEPNHVEELEKLLRGFLESVNKYDHFAPPKNLPALIEACKDFIFVPPQSLVDVIKGFFRSLIKK